MTQAQAIAKGYTHFIETWRNKEWEQGRNSGENRNSFIKDIKTLDANIKETNSYKELYTVCIFLIKLKPKQQ